MSPPSATGCTQQQDAPPHRGSRGRRLAHPRYRLLPERHPRQRQLDHLADLLPVACKVTYRALSSVPECLTPLAAGLVQQASRWVKAKWPSGVTNAGAPPGPGVGEVVRRCRPVSVCLAHGPTPGSPHCGSALLVLLGAYDPLETSELTRSASHERANREFQKSPRRADGCEAGLLGSAHGSIEDLRVPGAVPAVQGADEGVQSLEFGSVHRSGGPTARGWRRARASREPSGSCAAAKTTRMSGHHGRNAAAVAVHSPPCSAGCASQLGREKIADHAEELPPV